jgi:hypothetical protein
MIAADQALHAFIWSSYGSYLRPPRKRPRWLRTDRLLGEHGIQRESRSGRKQFAGRMEARRNQEADSDSKSVRRGWYLGSLQFRRELLGRMKGQLAEHHFGPERAGTEEETAEAVIAEGVKEMKWDEAELRARRKGDPGKVKLAARLRAETAVTLKWIARGLEMGSWTHLNHLLYWYRRQSKGHENN